MIFDTLSAKFSICLHYLLIWIVCEDSMNLVIKLNIMIITNNNCNIEVGESSQYCGA